MGLGKGTLKQQIEKDVFKQIKGIENTVDQSLRAADQLANSHEVQLRNFERKIEIWTKLQDANRADIKE